MKERKFFAFFSCSLGVQDSNTAEILAIYKTCDLCALNSNLASRDITIVNDSKVAVSWVNNKGVGSVKHVNTKHYLRH